MPAALVVPWPVKMPGYNSTSDLDEVQSLSSEFNYQKSSMPTSSGGLFPFTHTDVSTELYHGSSWGTSSTHGPQAHEFPDHGPSHSGDADEYLFTSGQTTPRGSRMNQLQSMESAWNRPRTTSGSFIAQNMSRADSSRSIGSSLSQNSRMSTGNASSRTVGVPTSAGDMTDLDPCLLVDHDDHEIPSQMYWPDASLDMSIMGASAFTVTDASPLHISPAHMHLGSESVLPDTSSPGSWDCFSSSISRTSSPATIDDAWLPSALSPHSSPGINGDLVSAERTVLHVADDSVEQNLSKLEHTITQSAGFVSRRQGSDGESSARDHELYKNAAPASDGLFHCPWEGQASCNHKPEKLKCNYDKFVDSHLKPYRCKAESCEGARFSSTACLLRHEREAHGLHGHGDKPFLCVYEGCERAVMGNGFPRQWNLRDHMKRVHNDHGSAGGSPTSGTTGPAPKGRKRKTEIQEPHVATRKATLKSGPVAAAKPINSKPLLEQWLDQRHAAEEILRSMKKPDDTRSLQQITEVQKRLSYMAKVTSELTSAPIADLAPETRRRDYTTG